MLRILMRYAVVGLAVLLAGFFLFMLNQIAGLADLVARYWPGAYGWVFWGLGGVFLTLCAAPVVLFYVRPGALRMPENPTEAEKRVFLRRLEDRLARNSLVREAGVDVVAPDTGEGSGVDRALGLLDGLATERAKSAARRIFLTTAVSQNGKLDSFVVLALLTKMIWDVSKVYNQRPSASDMLALYTNVAVASFIAGAVEELDIQDQIEAVISPVLAGSALGVLPGASGMTSVVTAAVMDGAANAFLALRVGIIARNYFNYRLDHSSRSLRRGAFREAGRLLMDIVVGAAKTVTGAYARSFTRAAGKGAARAADVVFKAAECTVRGASRAARSSAGAVGEAVRSATRRKTGPEAAGEPVMEPEMLEPEPETESRRKRDRLKRAASKLFGK